MCTWATQVRFVRVVAEVVFANMVDELITFKNVMELAVASMDAYNTRK